jgi:folylpolyglutamate synthase
MSDSNQHNALASADDDDVYTSAMTALYSTEHQATTSEALAKASTRRTRTVPDMHEYMKRIGLLGRGYDTDEISVIHVAGTKGKGSVSAMCESIVRNTHSPSVVTGLFTSPHLVDIRERIRINGRPVSKRVFGQAYWKIRERLEQYPNDKTSHDDDGADLPVLPGYFRMITLLALYIFRHYVSEDGQPISCIILEVGMGGRYDATNVHLPWSQLHRVCGIALIDYDHVRVLGKTLPEIAWEKAGIYLIQKDCETCFTPHPGREQDAYAKALTRLALSKPASNILPRCFALDTNDAAVLDVFRLCARSEGEGSDLHLAGPNHNPQLPPDSPLGLNGSHQRANAELAIALCRALWEIQRRNKCTAEDNQRPPKRAKEDTEPFPSLDPTTEAIGTALANVTWPGRCQSVIYRSDSDCESDIAVNVRLDGAHTEQSLRVGLEWFQSVVPSGEEPICRILIFNCGHERNPLTLLELLYPLKFHAVYFCQADSERPSSEKKGLAEGIWKLLGKELPADFDPSPYRENESDAAKTPSWQDTLLGLWNLMDHCDSTTPGWYSRRALDRAANLTAADALERGVRFGRTMEGVSRIEFLCTGSLYLVGSMLSALQWQEPEATGSLDE